MNTSNSKKSLLHPQKKSIADSLHLAFFVLKRINIKRQNYSFILTGILILNIIGCGGLGEMHSDLYQSAPICVDSDNGSDANDGRGWDNAVKTIPSAISLVSEYGEIWVKNRHTITTAITTSKSNIGLYGGFSGIESRREERDVLTGTTVNSSATGTDLLIVSDNVTNITIDGFVFSGISNSSQNIFNFKSGSSVYIRNCSFIKNNVSHIMLTAANVTTEDCSFTGNTGNSSGVVFYISAGTLNVIKSVFTGNNTASSYGGVIYQSAGTVSIADSEFSLNTALARGGCIYHSASDALTVISNSTFSSNSANNSGGCIYSQGTLSITNSTLSSNHSAGNGGGIYAGGTLTISGSKISSNYIYATTSSNSGGALYSASSANITDCVFSGNYIYGTGSASYGGGAMIASGSMTIDSSTFKGNSVKNSSGANGGALAIAENVIVAISNSTIQSNSATATGGGIYTIGNEDLTFSKSVIDSNSSVDSGGGMAFAGTGTVNIYNSIISRNDVTGGSGCGAIYEAGTTVKIYNSLLCNNNSSNSSLPTAATITRTDSGVGFQYLYNCTIINTVSNFPEYSNITDLYAYNTILYSVAPYSAGNTASFMLQSNSYSNVSGMNLSVLSALSGQFANFSGGDYRLSTTSQLINAGNNSYAYGSYDLDNTARIKGGTIDIGCYEKK